MSSNIPHTVALLTGKPRQEVARSLSDKRIGHPGWGALLLTNASS